MPLTSALKEINACQETSAVLGQKYSGYMTLYGAACRTGNVEEQELFRQQLLTLHELLLDQIGLAIHLELRLKGLR